MFSKKIGIKAKILIVMLFLTVIAFGFTAILTLRNINNLGDFTLESCDKLRNDAIEDSKNALMEHSREELLSMVTGQAMIAGVQLDRLEDELNMLANLAGRYLLGRRKMITRNNGKVFSRGGKSDSQVDKSRIVVYSEDSGEKYKQNLARISQLHSLLKFIYANQYNLDMIYLCTSDGYYISYPWTELQKDYSPFKRKWYQEAIKASGKTVWVGPYISANRNEIIMTCAKAVKNFQGEIIAVCGLDMTVKEITDSFVGMKLIHDGRAFLIDKEGNVLARRKMKSKGMQWYEDFKKDNLFRNKSKCLQKIAARMVAGERDVRRICDPKEKNCLPGESELYVAYAPIPITKWSIGMVIGYDVLTASVKKVEAVMENNIQRHEQHIKNYFDKNVKIYLTSGVLVLFLVMIWGIIFSHRITAPVLMLKKKAIKIARGDFKSGIQLHTGDELERLDKTFDRMTEDITQYMQHVSNTVREREKIEQEFTVASNIQSIMLPPEFNGVPKIAIESYLKPAHEVSGDFYNYFMVDEKHLFFCIGKVSGTGIPAAMFMAQAMTLLSHLGAMKVEPEELLFIVNNTLAINNKTDMSVTAFCGFLNIENGQLVFSNAKHVPMIYIHDGDVSAPQLEESLALGINSIEENVFKRNSLQLSRGDVLFFTTNGIDGTRNMKGKLFDEKYLLDFFKTIKNSRSSMIKFSLMQLKEFYGSQISKIDVALLAIDYKGVDI